MSILVVLPKNSVGTNFLFQGLTLVSDFRTIWKCESVTYLLKCENIIQWGRRYVTVAKWKVDNWKAIIITFVIDSSFKSSLSMKRLRFETRPL